MREALLPMLRKLTGFKTNPKGYRRINRTSNTVTPSATVDSKTMLEKVVSKKMTYEHRLLIFTFTTG